MTTAKKTTESTEKAQRTRREKIEKTGDADPLTQKVIGAAIEVHKNLGPGLLESVYEEALCREFEVCGLRFERQVHLDLEYKGVVIKGQRVDLIVENAVVVELKSVQQLVDVHWAQLLTYMRIAKKSRGLLINFNVPRLVDGVKRMVL